MDARIGCQAPDGQHLCGEDREDVTVLLGDDQVAMRAGVRRALESNGLRVVAEAAEAHEAVAAALRHRPSVCVLAVRMPGSGISAAEQIRKALPATKIVMLTASDRDEDLFAALQAGADGYLLKQATSIQRLPCAIRGVLNGEAALPRMLAGRLIREYRDRGRSHRLPLSICGRPVELTAREFQVLRWWRSGRSTSQIAVELRISEVTVRRHISSIEHKIGARDRRNALELLDRAEHRERTKSPVGRPDSEDRRHDDAISGGVAVAMSSTV